MAVVTVGGIAGCMQPSSLLGNGGNRASQAPEDADAVLVVNFQSIYKDEATKKLANAYFETAADSRYYSGPEDYQNAQQKIKDESGLSPGKLEVGVVFWDNESSQHSQPYAGIIFEASWTEDELVNGLEDSGPAFEESTYNGKTIYESQNEYLEVNLGIIEENHYVLGTADAVKDTIDVASGDEESIEKELINAFNSTPRNSEIRVAARVPQYRIPDKIPAGRDDGITLDAYRDVPYVSGSIGSSGDSIRIAVTMHAEDKDAAEEVKEQTEALVTTVESLESTSAELEKFLDDIEVSINNGSDVVISYEVAVEEAVNAIETAVEKMSNR